MPIFVSSPVADKIGLFPVELFVIVSSLTALPVSTNFKSSKVPLPKACPLTSNWPPNWGEVSLTKSATTELSAQSTVFAVVLIVAKRISAPPS